MGEPMNMGSSENAPLPKKLFTQSLYFLSMFLILGTFVAPKLKFKYRR